MPSKDKRRLAYSNHQQRAIRSGIAFHFSFEEWVAWWTRELGPRWMKKRGCRLGQYVMARNGDTGPYRADNVRCITCSANNSEAAHARHSSVLTEDQVFEARSLYVPFSKKFGSRALARRFGVCARTMHKIITGVKWKSAPGPIVEAHSVPRVAAF